MKVPVALVVFLTWISTSAAEPPKLGKKQDDYTGFADDFRRVICNIEGNKLRYEWFHNGTKVPSTSSMFYLARKYLIVSQNPASEKYQGTYQCKASNEDGTLLGSKINVAFSIVGKFEKSEDAVEPADVTVGKDLTLACPPRTLSRNIFYHWGGRRGVTGTWFMPTKKHYMIMENGALLFANVKEEDIDYFNVKKNGVSCGIESKGAIKRLAFSQRFLLREIGEKNKVPFGPTIKTTLKDREVANGTEFVVLRCGAVGLPTPEYSWTVTGLNGIERPIISGQDGYELQDFNHILMITSVETKHDGWYKCMAKSNYGGKENTDEVKGRISVKGKPQWARNGELSEATPTEGGGFQWSCKAFGNPEPSYTWLKNGETLSSTDTYTIDGGVLTFKSISQANEGLYQCNAENDFGYVSSSAILKMLPAPTVLPEEKCISTINLMFLLDGSGSVPYDTFLEFKKFMQLLVKKFVVGPQATHVAVIQYSSSDNIGVEFGFENYTTMTAVQHALSKIVFHYGAYTFGGDAMKRAHEEISAYSRQAAKTVIVMLMDQGTWDHWTAKDQSKLLRDKGIQIIILDTTKDKIMYEIADKGLEFTSAKLEENVEEVAKEICK